MGKVFKKLMKKVKSMVNEKKLPKKLPKFVPKEKDKTVVDIVKTITAVPSVSSVSVASPRCGEVTGFVNVKGSDFKCSRCGSGYSGFPPPKKE